MKIRYGFVSNSSSSSFCIHKRYMTKEQMEEFRQILTLNNDGYYVSESKNYFIGTVSQHNGSIFKFLEQFNRDDYAFGDW